MYLLAALIPFIPLLGFLINGLGYRKISVNSAGIIGSGSVLVSFLISSYLFVSSLSGEHTLMQISLFDWIVAGNVNVSFSFLIDHLTLIMLLIVTGVGFLIHVYSIGYMHGDEGFGKFFAYLNLFIFFMLILVMGANYVMMFIGWEGVGLCSYLLIGFWWKNREYSAAANKAFIMNRIGDLGFILGIFLLFQTFGTSDYQKVFTNALVFGTNDNTIVAITLLFFIGAMGKSAQIPLYTWLPDAMAGPTPVSALIHAATMVTAGVYMVVRSNVLYSIAPVTLAVITVIGLFTALLAALIALTQSDIKKVLAYSTVSQLGYMFVAAGSSAYASGIFHLTTHAFFKALLFLGAGSVIHAMHGEQNLRKMGGLKQYLPVTFITMAIATLAISGAPPFSAFFSKDEILLAAYGNSSIVFWLLSLTSVLTAVYMFRMFFMTFFGQFRGTNHQMQHLHESPRSITVPLIVLAVLSAAGGFLGLPEVFSEHHWLNQYLSPVFEQNPRLVSHEASHLVDYMIMVITIIVVIAAVYLTYHRYHLKKVGADLVESDLPFFYKLSYNKFYVDEIYQKLFIRPLEWFGDFFDHKIEKNVIDGMVNGSGGATIWLSSQLRKIQTGNIGIYMLAMVIGMVVILLIGLSQLKLF